MREFDAETMEQWKMTHSLVLRYQRMIKEADANKIEAIPDGTDPIWGCYEDLLTAYYAEPAWIRDMLWPWAAVSARALFPVELCLHAMAVHE